MRYQILVYILFLSTLAFSQDAVFSQFYALPVSLNPALSGTYDGKYRVSAIHREQWRSVVDEPFRTYGLGLDLRFDVDPKGINKDFFSGSIIFQTDRSGILEYTLNQMYLAGAYHKSLDNSRSQYLGAGIQIGMNQRSVNFSKINFQDQFNGIDGYTLPTLELLPENNIAHVNMAAGLNYIYAPKKNTAIYAGIALHNFLGPENSFFFKDPNDAVNIRGVSYKLPARISFHLASVIPVSEFLDIQPRVLAAMQGPNQLAQVGVNFKFYFLEYELHTLYLGTYLRLANNATSWSTDMLGFLVGYGYDNLVIGMSYDLTLSSLATYGRTRGAFELSVSYFGEYENEDSLCPMF
ncbi:MAG: PorP/SprF family type IX secretion system membrane protein [Saprospiraceae bacterium]|nr:PorP/SprF family type IX secretion system membrane protein [Saprospiraceae bacterium]